MAKSAILLLCGLSLIQIGLVRAQVAQTAWAAPTSGGAMGFMPPMRDFTDQQNHMAIMNINTARTEAEAAQAATAVFHPTLDTADIVKTALEDKIRQLRAANNPAWMPGMPLPRLPSHFDANDVIMASYYQNMAPAAPPQRPGPPFGAPQPGPRTNIRRGVSPQRRQGPPIPGTPIPGTPMPGPPVPGPPMPGPPMSGPPMPGPPVPGPPMSGPPMHGSVITRSPMHPPPMMGSPMGAMASYYEPTQWQVDMAVHDINAATTEQAALKAAARVYRVGLDTPDVVVNAVEEKIARLRNPTWTRRRPPPIPMGLNVLSLILRAFQEAQAAARVEAAKAAEKAAAAAKAAASTKPTPPAGPSPKTGPPGPRKPPRPPKPAQGPNKTRKVRPSAPPTRAEVDRPLPQDARPPPRGDFMANMMSPRRRANSDGSSFRTVRQRISQQMNFRDAMMPQRDSSRTDPFLSGGPFASENRIPGPPRRPVAPPRPKANAPGGARQLPPTEAPRTVKPREQMLSIGKAEAYTHRTIVKRPTAEPPKTTIKSKSALNERHYPFMKKNTPEKMSDSNTLPSSPKDSSSSKTGFERPSRRPSDSPILKTAAQQKSKSSRPSSFSTSKGVEGLFGAPRSTSQTKQLDAKTQKLATRYPGLILKGQRPSNVAPRTYMEKAEKAITKRSNVAQREYGFLGTKASVPIVQGFTAPTQKPFKRVQQIWSPSGNLGKGINDLLQFSLNGNGESIPIIKPTTTPPPTTTTTTPTTTTTTTTTPAPTTTTTTTRKPTTKAAKPEVSEAEKARKRAIALQIVNAISKTKSPTDKPAKNSIPTEAKMALLQDMLATIPPDELQNLIKLIKARSADKKKPAAPSVPSPPSPPSPLPEPRRFGPIPPPPGSENAGMPPRQTMMAPRGPPGPQGGMRGGPPGGPPDRQWGPPPRGGPQGGPPFDLTGGQLGGGPPGGRNGPPGGMNGPPGGFGGRRGGGLDPNSPQVQRLLRIIAGRAGGARGAAAGGEAPEAPEGGGMMNPMMLNALMRGGGGGAGGLEALLGGGGGGPSGGLGALLGGSGGGLGALLGGGGPGDMFGPPGGFGGGGSQLDMLTAAMNPGGASGPPGETGSGSGGSGGGLGGLSALLNLGGGGGGGPGGGPAGGLQALLAAAGRGGPGRPGLMSMMNPDGPGGGLGAMSLFGAGLGA